MVNKKTYSVRRDENTSATSNTVTFDYTGLDETTVNVMSGPYEQCEIIRLQGVDRKTLRAGHTLSPHTIVVREGRPTRMAKVVTREMTTEEMLAALKASGKLNDEMIAVIMGSAE